jgi:uncharacterized membrane-anchored protein
VTPALSRVLVAGAVLLVLGTVNWSILAKERIKTHGEVILLELAPVDPRSLMQGDYMALRFALANSISPERGGSAPLAIDEQGVATLNRSPATARLHVRYRIRNGQVWLGTNAYFFEEGTAERFANARYGEFRLDRDTGEAVLTGLRDAAFRPL